MWHIFALCVVFDCERDLYCLCCWWSKKNYHLHKTTHILGFAMHTQKHDILLGSDKVCKVCPPTSQGKSPEEFGESLHSSIMTSGITHTRWDNLCVAILRSQLSLLTRGTHFKLCITHMWCDIGGGVGEEKARSLYWCFHIESDDTSVEFGVWWRVILNYSNN